MNWLAQVAAVTRFGLQTMPERKGACLSAAVGIAGVVAVLVGVLSIAEGFRKTMTSVGAPDTAIVFRGGSDSEMTSILGRDEVRIIAQAPGVARDENGPLASGELFVIINLPKKTTGTDANVPLRGVEPAAFGVREELRIVEGRPFAWGRNEVIVGRGAAEAFAGLELGRTFRVGKNDWKVVGIFTAEGGVVESEIWTDAAVLQPAYQRGTTFQAVYAKLDSPEAFGTFKDALTADPRLNVKVVREIDYYAEQSTALYNLITGLGTLVAGLMGIAAVFGALNTMYTAVASRTREIATLRALGFRASPVVLSILAESLAIALAGGLVGAGLAYAAFDGFRTATINWQSFSQVVFAFDVTPGLLLRGLTYALVLGFVGGLLPALRAARLPVAAALREP